MGCGGSKSTTVVENNVNVNVQRPDSANRRNDIIHESASRGEKVGDPVQNGGNVKGTQLNTNDDKILAINNHAAVKEDTAGRDNNFILANHEDEIDGRKSHSSEKAQTKDGLTHERGHATNLDRDHGSPSKKAPGEEKTVVSTKNTKLPSKKDGPHGVGKGKEKKTTSPLKGSLNQLSKDDHDPKPEKIVRKADQNVTKTASQRRSQDNNRDLKTESPFDPSVNVEKYRKGPIPVFGRDAFPLSKKNPDLKIEDTFWPGKRALIPDYSKMKKLDKHAIETPSQLRDDMGKLVAHLTKVASSDLEKLRVVFRWVAHNIVYNVQGFKTGNLGNNSAESVLKTGKAVCEGYSNLLSAMCAKAGVECEKVSGYAKGYGYEPGKDNLSKQAHAWNKVTLDGKIYFCDCTWAAGHVGDEFTRSWKEQEFLVEPRNFANTHMPRDINSQFTSTYKSREEWNNAPVFGRLAQFIGLECLTHKKGIIMALDNTCLVRIKLQRALYNTFFFIENEDRKKMEGVVQHWWNGNELSCSVRLPKAGRYTLMILGRISLQRSDSSDTEILYPEHPNDVIGNRLLTYIIKSTGNKKNKPLSSDKNSNPLFGAPVHLTEYGLTPASENLATITAVAGSAHVVFKKIHQDFLSIVVELYKFGESNNKLTSSVYCEQFDDWVVSHVRCPSAGKYSLIMYVKSASKGNSCHVRYTVVSEGTFDPIDLPDMTGISGPHAKFAELGLFLKDALTTTIVTRDGETQLRISSSSSKKVKIIANLKDVSGNSMKDGSYLVETNTLDTEQVTTVCLRIKQKGFFKLSLFAKDDSMSTSQYIGDFLVVCRKTSIKETYPSAATDVGPTSDFHTLGLQTTVSSRVVCAQGEGTLEVLSKSESNIDFTFNLTKGQKEKLDGQIFADTFVLDKMRVTRFHFRMNQVGIFAFRLFAKSKGENGQYDYVGVWLVENDSVGNKPGYPGRKNVYGPNSYFWDSGLSIDDGVSKKLDLYDGEGELCFTHKPGANRRVTAHLETGDGGRPDQSSVSTLIEGTWSNQGNTTSTKLKLRLKKPGVYDLRVFIENEKENGFTFAGVWLVDCSKATTKTSFPDVKGTMGPRTNFFEMGLAIKAPYSSTLSADDNGVCTLQVFRKKPFNVIFKESDKKCDVSVTKSETVEHSFTCKVKLPSPELYTLDLFASEPGVKKKEFMGKWLLEWKKK